MNTGYWGPLSGISATVGGALSQNSAFFGSTLHGTVADHVLGVTVLLATGDVVTTGSGGRVGTQPFTRYAGPDMTGLFLGDTGAFGLKLAATLKLEPAPQHLDYLGFGFDDMRAMALAQVEMSAVRAISEASASIAPGAEFGQRQQAERRRQDPWQRHARRRAAAGNQGRSQRRHHRRRLPADHACSLHLVVEGSSADGLAASMAALRASAPSTASRRTRPPG
jgi:D-lactate dehydrogenase (cytochrome)